MSTLRERADEWFGKSNLDRMVAVPLGRRRAAFVSATHLFIYEERDIGTPRTMVAGITPKMRVDLIAALKKEPS